MTWEWVAAVTLTGGALLVVSLLWVRLMARCDAETAAPDGDVDWPHLVRCELLQRHPDSHQAWVDGRWVRW